MKEYINNLQRKLSDIQYVLLAAILSICITTLLEPLVNIYEKYFGKIGGPVVGGEYKIFMAFFLCIIGPIIESFLIVFIVKVLKDKLNICKKINIYLITLSIFSILHYYSLLYIIIIFITSSILIYSYLYYEPKKLSSVSIIISIHIIMNFTSLLFNYILEI